LRLTRVSDVQRTYDIMFFNGVCVTKLYCVFRRPVQRFITLKPKSAHFNATDAVIIMLHTYIPVVNIPIIIIIVTTIDINRRESTVQEILLLLYRYQPIIFSCDAQRNDTSYITGKFVHSKHCIMYVQPWPGRGCPKCSSRY